MTLSAEDQAAIRAARRRREAEWGAEWELRRQASFARLRQREAARREQRAQYREEHPVRAIIGALVRTIRDSALFLFWCVVLLTLLLVIIVGMAAAMNGFGIHA